MLKARIDGIEVSSLKTSFVRTIAQLQSIGFRSPRTPESLQQEGAP